MLIRYNIYYWMCFALPLLHPSPVFIRSLWCLKVGLCAESQKEEVDLKALQ